MEKILFQKNRFFALTTGLLLAGSINTFASDDSVPGFTLSPSIGFVNPGNERNLKTSDTKTIAAGYQFDSPWAIELAYMNADTEFRNSSTEVDVRQIRLDSLYYLPQMGAIKPYTILGLGQSKSEFAQFSDDDTFANVGLGFKYALNNALSLRSDIRLSRYSDSDATDMGINFGLSYAFNGNAKNSRPSNPVQAAVEPKPPVDTDGDGVPDSKDHCVNTPAGASVNWRGCKIDNDTDKDGIPNAIDECPETKEGAKVDAKGCYLILKEDVSVNLNITFANNSDKVVSDSEDQIRSLASFMKQYPQTQVVIRGYTDDRGNADYNQQLSQKRADAVSNILTQDFDINADRITSKGFGESHPIADNGTAEGRAKNRRVEAVVKATIEKTVE